MPTATKYSYTIATAFPNHVVSSDRLTQEIQSSAIVIALGHIDTTETVADVWFKDVLSAEDVAALDALVAAHSGEPLPEAVQAVSIFGAQLVDGRLRTEIDKPSGGRTTQVTFNFAKPTTWYCDAARVVNETPTEPEGEAYYQLSHVNVIDTYHGLIMGENYLKDAAGNSYRVVVTVDGVVKKEKDPHTFPPGFVHPPGYVAPADDYEIDYALGRITPLTWTRGAAAVTVTYHYARTSKFWVRPAAGKRLKIKQVECQFSTDIDMRDTAIFQPKALAAAMGVQGLPIGTKLPAGIPLVYKTMQNFYDDAMRAYPIYPSLGGNSWRGCAQPGTVLDWDYTQSTPLVSSVGAEIEVCLEHDVPFGGQYATVTWYCDSEPET